MPNRHLVIRADASSRMGIGHVMRCLALAQVWQDQVGSVTFASADLPTSVADRLLSEGFELERIAAVAGSPDDAKQLLELASIRQATAIVIDGYQFSESFHDQVCRFVGTTATIDDDGRLGRYAVDVVVNQNLGARESIYANRASHTKLLLGTQYALLRREFLKFPPQAKPLPSSNRRILVTLGGADPDNVTLKVLEGIEASVKLSFQTRVLIGGANPHFDLLNRRFGGTEGVELLRDIADMAAQYDWADIVFAAGGSSNWEMCYFGLPRIVVVLADNQRPIAGALEAAGVAVNLGDARGLQPNDVSDALRHLVADESVFAIAQQAATDLVDGDGARRVVDRIAGMRQWSMREASFDDWQFLLNLRNDPVTRAASRQTEEIDAQNHRDWLKRVLADSNRQIYIAESAASPVGMVRIDIGADECEISWAVAAEFRGRGIGSKMVLEAANLTKLPIRAVVRATNVASKKIALGAGFSISENDGNWITLRRDPKPVGDSDE